VERFQDDETTQGYLEGLRMVLEANGNLMTKADANNDAVATSQVALNRVTSKTYSTPPWGTTTNCCDGNTQGACNNPGGSSARAGEQRHADRTGSKKPLPWLVASGWWLVGKFRKRDLPRFS
jgi:hypothetical protein